MPYIPTTWVNKTVERPKTYTFQNNVDGSTTLIPAEGVVAEAGTPADATNFNKIETGIVNAQAGVDALNTEINGLKIMMSMGAMV